MLKLSNEVKLSVLLGEHAAGAVLEPLNVRLIIPIHLQSFIC